MLHYRCQGCADQKGASGEVCAVLSAFGEAFLSIATSNRGTPIVHTMTGFCKDCIRTRRPRPRAFRVLEGSKMNDQQKKEQYSGVQDQQIRAALDRHWAASDANDFETEHRIYHEDAVLEYPQSGERTRGRRNIQNQRASQPSKKRFAVRRIIGGGDLWITEFILTYDGKPSYTVSIMEFRGDKVARETQYFADAFVAPAGRAQWVERMEA
jgi:ketosteroid isomerase-like protein